MSESDASPSKKYPLRLQMPVDDPDVDAFLAAQGVRFQSQAIVMLIRMWVNEFGPTNVLEQTMGAVTASALKQHPVATRSSDGPTTPQAPSAPRQSEALESSASVKQTASPSRLVTPQPAPSTTAGPSDDFEDLFRKTSS